jgi:glycosyltransferase involved in cell wall biosynthesis
MFFISSLREGGAEGVCVSLANGMAERGHCVTVVVLHLSGATRQVSLTPRVRLVNLGVNHSRWSWKSAAQILREENPDTVMAFNWQLAVVLALIRRGLSLRFRLIARNANFLSESEKAKPGIWHGWLLRHLGRVLYPLVDSFVAQSEAMRTDLISYLGVDQSRVTVIHNPVSATVVAAANSADCVPHHRRKYLLCIGRLVDQKAFHSAMAAFSQIAGRHPELRLKIVGQGERERDLRQLAQSLGLTHRIDFCGFQSDVASYYKGAKFTLLTSYYEGFPNVLVESLALGTPVVSFDCPSGPREIVLEGVNGFLVPPGNIALLVESMEKALVHTWDARQVADTVKPFNLDGILDKYEHAFER